MAEKGVLSLIVTKVPNPYEDTFHLDFTVLNTKEGEKHIDRKVAELKEGDILTLSNKNIEEPSSPIDIKKVDKKSDQEQMVKEYYSLKKRLEKEGFI